MPRGRRFKSEYETYHVMIRGINKQSLFEDDEDRIRFLDTLKRYKKECGYDIYAWCLMDNHVHLVMRFIGTPIERCMQKIQTSYAYYFNMKYSRVGHLMQDRYRSEVIATQRYLYNVVRYVHNNPVKSSMCILPEDYVWSSYRQYLRDGGMVAEMPAFNLTNTNFLLNMCRIEGLVAFTNAPNKDRCLDLEEPYNGFRKSDDEARIIMKDITGCQNATEFQNLPMSTRAEAFVRMYDSRINILQISRLTGVSRTVINKALKGNSDEQ